ncbi:MAG: hypothetical protein ACI9S8_001650 [Chlamydiales bacterium]|jgi:hypothetical protein
MWPTFLNSFSPSNWFSGMTSSVRAELRNEYLDIEKIFNQISASQENSYQSILSLENRVTVQKNRIPTYRYNSERLEKWKTLKRSIEKNANEILLKKYQENDLELSSDPQSKLRTLELMLDRALHITTFSKC